MSNNLLSQDLDEITESLLLHEDILVGISSSLKNYTVQNKSYLDNQEKFIDLLSKVQILHTQINTDAKQWYQSLEKTIKFQEEKYPVIFNEIQQHILKQQADFITYLKVLGTFEEKHQRYIQLFKEFEEKHIEFFAKQQKDFETNGVNTLIKEQLSQKENFNNLKNEINNFSETLLEIKTSQLALVPNKKVIWYKRGSIFIIMIFLLCITPDQIKNFLIYIWNY